MGKISIAMGCITAWIKLAFAAINFGTIILALLIAAATGLASYLGQYIGKLLIKWVRAKYFAKLPEP